MLSVYKIVLIPKDQKWKKKKSKNADEEINILGF